VSSANKE